jgi:hypothetical protein
MCEINTDNKIRLKSSRVEVEVEAEVEDKTSRCCEMEARKGREG